MFKETKQRTKLDFIIKNTSFENDSYEKIRDINDGLFVNPKNHGKINTPLSLVREMVSKLPEDVFQVGKKVLDPACKNGIFLKVIHMIRQQLGQSEEEIQNDLYGFEPDPVLVSVAKHITGLKNIYIKDFIREEINMKFDLIIGNPPYQASNDSGTESLWKKFLKNGMLLLNDGGYILFITPNGWLIDNKARPFFVEYNSIYANVKSELREKYFNLQGSSFSYYLIQKEKNKGIMKLETDDGMWELDWKVFTTLPTKIVTPNSISIHKKLIIDREKFDVINDNKYRDISREKNEVYLYPAYYTHAQPCVYTKMPRYIEKKKVVFSECGTFKPFYENGNSGVVWHGCHIEVNNETEGRRLIDFLNSKVFRFVEQNSRNGGFSSIVNDIPEIDLTKDWTNTELYVYFKLNSEEIKLIEENV